MKGSLFIGKIAGIKLFIHWTFLLLIAWISFMDYLGGKGIPQILLSVLFILTVFVCIMLHEFGHALVAKHFHYITKDINLLPVGGIARMEDLPESPKEELLVSLAGPAINLIIAALLFPFIHWDPANPIVYSALLVNADTFLFNLFAVNTGLVIFNLLPAFPMDGGRVFRAFLSFFMDRVTATNIAVKTGQVIAALLFFIGIFYNPLLTIISILIFIFAQTENDFVKAKKMLHTYSVRDVLIKNYYSLSPEDTISYAMNMVLEKDAKHFLIIENNNVIGTIEKEKILKVLNQEGVNFKLRPYIQTEVHFFNADEPLDKVYSGIHFTESVISPVLEKGSLIGIIDANAIEEFIALKKSSSKQPQLFFKNKFDY